MSQTAPTPPPARTSLPAAPAPGGAQRTVADKPFELHLDRELAPKGRRDSRPRQDALPAPRPSQPARAADAADPTTATQAPVPVPAPSAPAASAAPTEPAVAPDAAAAAMQAGVVTCAPPEAEALVVAPPSPAVTAAAPTVAVTLATSVKVATPAAGNAAPGAPAPAVVPAPAAMTGVVTDAFAAQPGPGVVPTTPVAQAPLAPVAGAPQPSEPGGAPTAVPAAPAKPSAPKTDATPGAQPAPGPQPPAPAPAPAASHTPATATATATATAPAGPDASASAPAAPSPVPGQPAPAAPPAQPDPAAQAAPPVAPPAAPGVTVPATPQAVPVAPPVVPNVPTEPRPGVRLQHAAETVRLTITSASAAGVSRARIALRPAELGGIEIMLSHGPGGVSATVTAESPAAAHALQRAADQLQRSLADNGVNLVRLDIDVAGDRAGASGRDDRDRGARHGDGRAPAHGGADTDSTPTVERTLELPGGVLVDVLA
ncbi:MAG: hypothetical protein QOJ85_1922 [Solirubrobacteraceae bacterium]|nr:hypothetical protein [Solirubrobacteraceae bacterium]